MIKRARIRPMNIVFWIVVYRPISNDVQFAALDPPLFAMYCVLCSEYLQIFGNEFSMPNIHLSKTMLKNTAK